jgi:predicted adenylyl cyclase CyaB
LQNIELKARVNDPEALRAVVAALGARFVWERLQRDTFFGVPRGYLKLREVEGEPAELIAYERAPGSRLRPSDYEIATVADGAELRAVLARSLEVRGVVAKRRVLYLWEHTRIHLDEVEGLGTFLELETVVAGITVEEAHTEAARVMEALRIRSEDLLDRPYLELLADRRREST